MARSIISARRAPRMEGGAAVCIEKRINAELRGRILRWLPHTDRRMEERMGHAQMNKCMRGHIDEWVRGVMKK